MRLKNARGGPPNGMRFLNGFVLIGVVLLGLSIAGLATHNRLLTEPGQPTNPYAWLQYLAAAIIMLVNGIVSIWTLRRPDGDKAVGKQAAAARQEDQAG